jgi:hypothetical protein
MSLDNALLQIHKLLIGVPMRGALDRRYFSTTKIIPMKSCRKSAETSSDAVKALASPPLPN